MKSDRKDLYKQLRKEYPFFIYEGFSYTLNNNELHIVFDFRMGNEHFFRPEISLALPAVSERDILSDSLIRNIIFNMGMIELISYWKAACPPEVIIRPMKLTDDQISWWKKLYLNGLGEFFYENGISPENDFMKITSEGGEKWNKLPFRGNEEVIVPLGGGKDSVVTLELLSKVKKCRPLIINPREASLQSALRTGYKDDQIIRIRRSIDPGLLELNGKGFLNGHTPFSAMLAFTSLLAASVYGIPEIALSNESSANEPSIPGTNINHQYSKSLEFENDFRQYISSYLTKDIDYYSYLRPLNELQIAGIFSCFPHHFPTFKSCNVGSKTDSWCGKCPKCLFTYIMLAVFIEKKQLDAIFGNNLLEDEELLPIFEQLCGLADEKPFECVGTIDEVNAAIRSIMTTFRDGEMPFLLKKYIERTGMNAERPGELGQLLKSFSIHHIPGYEELCILKDMIDAFGD